LNDGFNWLRIAATRGNVAAQNRLAHAYVSALGTRPNPVEAAKWFILSRRAGLNDPSLEDYYLGLPTDQQKQAIDAANKYRSGRPVAARSGDRPAAKDPAADHKPVEPPSSTPAVGLPGVSVPPAGVIETENDADDGENTDVAPSAPAAKPAAP
jgi:TPR repeat protein